MKLLTILLAPIVAVVMASTALAGDYKDLVAGGYRWVTIDGPYLYRTKEDLREITRDPSKLNRMRMVEERGAYFLIEGALVKVIQEDRSSGMAQVRALELPGIFGRTTTFSAGDRSRMRMDRLRPREGRISLPPSPSVQMGAV